MKHRHVSQISYEEYMEYERAFLLEYGDFVQRSFQTNAGEFQLSIPKYADSWYEDGHEPGLGSELSNTLSHDTTFYDVGVQFGYFIEFAISVGVKPANIHGFEAKTNHWAQLMVEDSDTAMNLNNARVSDQETNSTVTIDSYARRTSSPPDVIKIDVEGAEGDVINGMKGVLDSDKPTIYIEMHPESLPKFGYMVEDIYSTLREYEYDISLSDHRSRDSDWVTIGDESRIEGDSSGTYLLRARA